MCVLLHVPAVRVTAAAPQSRFPPCLSVCLSVLLLLLSVTPPGTVDCEYPRWIEFLCHDISVHVPHHVNSKIPWYNLRAANESLKQNWGQYMTSCTFNWRMMKTIFTGAAHRLV